MATDKKKVTMLAGLGVLLLGVGAWQFVGKSDSKKEQAPVKKDEPRTVAVETPEPSVEEDWSLTGLTRKDPFIPGTLRPDPDSPTPAQAPRPGDSTSPPPRPRLRPDIFGGPLPPISPGTEVRPSEQMRDPNEFAYTLVGIVEGPNPVAVFQTDSGTQTMVKINGYVGPNSKVVSIRNGRATVLHNGKRLTLTVGGSSK